MNSILCPQKLAARLNARIRGQSEAVESLSWAVARSEAGLGDQQRPRGSFLLLGPTGVGKTFLCRALAREVNRYRPLPFHCFDMAEYQTEDSLRRLLGPDPLALKGRLGNLLDESAESGAWILFDEIEKAHPLVQTFFLGPLENGTARFGDGGERSFRNTYLTFTSNLGGGDLMHLKNLPRETFKRHTLNVAEDHFRPEVFNRFSEKLVFNRLDFEEQATICRDLIDHYCRSLDKILGWYPSYDDSVIYHLLRLGFNRELGARPLRETIYREVGNALLRCLQERRNGAQVRLTCAAEGNLIIVHEN